MCNHCGHSVAWGSGRFVNRIPDLNDIDTRVANGLPYPLGDYVCDDCDRHPAKFYARMRKWDAALSI